MVVWLLVVSLASAFYRNQHFQWPQQEHPWTAAEPKSKQPLFKTVEEIGVLETQRQLEHRKGMPNQRSRSLETTRLKKKKKSTNEEELEFDRKKKASLASRRHAPDRHQHANKPPLFTVQSSDRPSPSPVDTVTTIGGLVIGARHGNAKGSNAKRYRPYTSSTKDSGIGSAQQLVSGGTFREGRSKSDASSSKGKGKRKKTSKGSKGKSGKMSGRSYYSYDIARDQVLTPAPLAFRLEPQPEHSQTETTPPSPVPTPRPSPQQADKLPTYVPTFAEQLFDPTIAPTPSSPSIAKTIAPTPESSLQPDVTQIPGLITLTFPPTESPTFGPVPLNTTAPSTAASPSSLQSSNLTLTPTAVSLVPSPSASTSPSAADSLSALTPRPTLPLTTNPPTADTGVRRIRVEPFYIGFEAPAPERAPVQDEYDYIVQLTTLYFEEIFATLYRDAEFSFDVIELTLLYTGFETGFPEERFTIYMEFGADMIFSAITDDTVDLPAGTDMLEVMIGAVDETYVVQYIWTAERESPFFRTQDVTAAVAPLKLPDGDSISIDIRGRPRDKSSDNVVADSRGSGAAPAQVENSSPAPIPVDGQIATSESYKQLSSRFILPGTSILEQLFQTDDKKP